MAHLVGGMAIFKGQHKNKSLGALGETHAEADLLRRGWCIRDKNWRSHPYEIDLIAQKNNLLIFVEVKSTAGPRTRNPRCQVRWTKGRSLRRAAYRYLNEHPFRGEIRFDLIECWLAKGKEVQCRHWEDFWTYDNLGLLQGFTHRYELQRG